MVRIGINVPKELHQRIQPLKGTMNISEICREAIEARVKKYEEFAGWLDSENAKQVVAEICEKELERKAMVEVDWETLGYRDGKEWAAAATIADWDYWNRCRNDESKDVPIWRRGRYVHEGLTKGRFISPSGVKTFHERHQEYTQQVHAQDDDFWEWMYETYDGLPPGFYIGSEQDYGRGWMTFTTAVWEMICKQREQYQLRWEQERTDSRRTRPGPEIPEHILEDIQRGR